MYRCIYVDIDYVCVYNTCTIYNIDTHIYDTHIYRYIYNKIDRKQRRN